MPNRGMAALPGRLYIARDDDRPAIFRARHEVYARELHQHAENSDGTLTDPIDAANEYLLARGPDGALHGFISITPPAAPRFSLEKYLPPSDWPVPRGDGVFEIRLLTVLPHARGRLGSPGAVGLSLTLMHAALRAVATRGGRHIVMMGRREVLPMYHALGLKSSGRQICSGEARYELMSATVPELEARALATRRTIARARAAWAWDLPFPPESPAPCFHGGLSIREAGDRLQLLGQSPTVSADVLDAWFEPAPAVLEALRDAGAAAIRTSPPADCGPLIRAIADARGVPRDTIVVGAGSSDLIFRCLRDGLHAGSRVLLPEPTYGEYAHVLQRVIGCSVERLPLRERDGWRIDLREVRRRAAARRFDLIILVNPNSPTGTLIDPVELRSQLHDFARLGTRVWLDETYLEYAAPGRSLEPVAAADGSRTTVCKSMSKVYALSGLRVAYAVMPASDAARIRAITPPWAVSLPGQIAGIAALSPAAARYCRSRWTETAHLRAQLAAGLHNLGLAVWEGVANFILVRGSRPACDLVADCISCGVYLRDVGIHNLVRVAVKGPAENARTLEALRHATRRTHAPP